MIVVALKGGLGNQLFQYAAARRLSLKRGTPLLLDTSELHDPQRPYALHAFNIAARFAPSGARDRFEATTLPERVFRRLRRRTLLQEWSPAFNPRVLDVPGSVYFAGYWQCERYFADVAADLRRELTFKDDLSECYAATADCIGRAPSVSVHVRRGDYVSSPVTNRFHGTCSVAYYRAAAAIVRERVPGARFFVFSDDPDWSRAHLDWLEPVEFIEPSAPASCHDDLRLMARCHHHVIANSSFSWWGAWLSEHDAKIVIAPERWFADSSSAGRDIVPDGWIRLNA